MARTGRCTAALDAKKSQIQTTMYRSFFVIFEPKIAEVVGDDEQSGARNVGAGACERCVDRTHL